MGTSMATADHSTGAGEAAASKIATGSLIVLAWGLGTGVVRRSGTSRLGIGGMTPLIIVFVGIAMFVLM